MMSTSLFDVEHAERYARVEAPEPDPEYIQHINDEKGLQKSYESGIKSNKTLGTLGGHANHGFQYLKFNDGTEGLMKTPAYTHGVTNNLLAQRVGRLVGADIPATMAHPTRNRSRLIMRRVDAPSGYEMDDEEHPAYHSPSSENLRLFDNLVGMPDRHPGNYLVHGNNLIGLDHDLVFNPWHGYGSELSPDPPEHIDKGIKFDPARLEELGPHLQKQQDYFNSLKAPMEHEVLMNRYNRIRRANGLGTYR